MDFRFYKYYLCHYALAREYIYFEDRSLDSCMISKPALAHKTYLDLNTKILKRLTKHVDIEQPKLSYNDSVIVKSEFRLLKLKFAISDPLIDSVSMDISDELYRVLKKYPANEHVFIDYLNRTSSGFLYFTNGMLKCFVINLEEKKIKYYKMIQFCVQYNDCVPPDQTIRRILNPYILHLKKVRKKRH